MKPSRILIFRIGHLGDTLISLPAFWALRQAFPEAKLTLLTNQDRRNPHYISPANVLPKGELVDEILGYPTNIHGLRVIAARIRLIAAIRRRRFDAVVYLMTRNRTPEQIDRDARFFRLCGIAKILGIEHLRQNLLPQPIPRPTPAVISEAQFLIDCLRAENLDFDYSALRTDLALSSDEESAAALWLAKATGFDGGKRLIAVAPGSKWDSKLWPEERFRKVVERLIQSRSVFPVVFGGPEDREQGDRLTAGWGMGANAAGELSVRESAALLAQCELYLGNDTGTMHLAAAVGIRCVAIFAAIDWIGRWNPIGIGHHLFRERVECEGCHSPICLNNRKCLDAISVEDVTRACEKVLIESKRGTVLTN